MERIRKVLMWSLILSLVGTALITVWFGHTSYEEELLRMRLEQEGIVTTGSLEEATSREMALLIDYGYEAYLAEQRYPGKAFAVYRHFGQTAELKQIIRQFGYPQVVPVVWYYLYNESTALELQSTIERAVKEIRIGEKPSFTWEELDSVPRGWAAINLILANGNDFLGQFAIDEDGVASRLQTQRVFALLKEFLTGNVIRLETKWQLGEEIKPSDVVWAAADITLVALGGHKLLARRAAKAAVGTTSASTKAVRLGLVTRTRILLPKLLPSARVMKWTAIGVGGYLLVKHRAAFNGLLGAVAESVGLPWWVGVINGWVLILLFIFFPVLYLISFSLVPFARHVALPILRRTIDLSEREVNKGRISVS